MREIAQTLKKGKKVKTIRIHQYGGPEVLSVVDVKPPVPGPDELLVKIHAASVNPVDWKIRAGYMKDYFSLTFPATLGFDISGISATKARRRAYVLPWVFETHPGCDIQPGIPVKTSKPRTLATLQPEMKQRGSVCQRWSNPKTGLHDAAIFWRIDPLCEQGCKQASKMADKSTSITAYLFGR